MQMQKLCDIYGIMKDAIANKFIDKPLTQQQLAAFYPGPNLGK